RWILHPSPGMNSQMDAMSAIVNRLLDEVFNQFANGSGNLLVNPATHKLEYVKLGVIDEGLLPALHLVHHHPVMTTQQRYLPTIGFFRHENQPLSERFDVGLLLLDALVRFRGVVATLPRRK